MPFYELTLICSSSRSQLTAAAARSVLDLKSTVRSCFKILWGNKINVHALEYLGESELPWIMSRHGQCHQYGHRFIVKMFADASNVSIDMVKTIRENKDVLQANILNVGHCGPELALKKYCDRLESHEKCMFGELSDEMWFKKRNFKLELEKKSPYFKLTTVKRRPGNWQ